MSDDRVDYRAWLLRVWPSAAGGCRATLEDAHTGERLAFATLAQLAAYLEGMSEAAGADDECAGS
jgi:hypothetical protein